MVCDIYASDYVCPARFQVENMRKPVSASQFSVSLSNDFYHFPVAIFVCVCVCALYDYQSKHNKHTRITYTFAHASNTQYRPAIELKGRPEHCTDEFNTR